jgi:hypothetical protein
MISYNKCKNEQDFKMTWFKRFKKYYADMFCIETEETVGGFPDVMALGYNQQAHFFEFKFTKTGKIKFQPTQPAFYKQHNTMDITVLALWQTETGTRVYAFPVSKMFEDGHYHLNERGEIDLHDAPMEGMFIAD